MLCTCLAPQVETTALNVTLKKKKGKKKDLQVHPALERIMGYTGSDMSEEEVRTCPSAPVCLCVLACMCPCTRACGQCTWFGKGFALCGRERKGGTAHRCAYLCSLPSTRSQQCQASRSPASMLQITSLCQWR